MTFEVKLRAVPGAIFQIIWADEAIDGTAITPQPLRGVIANCYGDTCNNLSLHDMMRERKRGYCTCHRNPRRRLGRDRQERV